MTFIGRSTTYSIWKASELTFLTILKLPASQVKKHPLAFFVALAVVVAAAVYPADPNVRRTDKASVGNLAVVNITEDYLRHVNWVLPIGLAVVCRDFTGLKQITAVLVAGTAATHIPKRLLNDVVIFGNRLGQRPYSTTSNYNMPSGHSALSSGGAYVLVRRFSPWLALIGVPILLLTMHARVILDAHTISATICGAATGFVVGALFCTKLADFRQRVQQLLVRGRR